MADTLVRFKPITPEDVFKGVDKTYSATLTATGGTDGADQNLIWYYVDRTGTTVSSLTDDLKNLFHSFGIAREDENDWFKVFNVVDWYNSKRMVIASIPQSGCSSYIDGSTIRLNVPTGTTDGGYTTFYGSNFKGVPDPISSKQVAPNHSSGNYGGAYCLLFADTQGTGSLPVETYSSTEYHPYTGSVNGSVNPNAGSSSFDPDNETLAWSTAEAKLSPHLQATHWQQGDDGYDQPYGIALLEKGMFIIFDYYNRTDFIGNTHLSGSSVWTASNDGTFVAMSVSGTPVENSNDNIRQDIAFTGSYASESAKLTYRTIDQSWKMIYFCHAGQSEFNSTSNHTYNSKQAYFRPEEADSLWVTEIGLYDDSDSLLAIGKLSEPVEKNKLETLTFKVELQL